MMLSGLASTTDVDIEHLAFAPFAFDPLPADVPFALRSYPDQVAGIIETLAHNVRGRADDKRLRRSSRGPPLQRTMCSLHDTDRQSFFARVEKVRLREISLVRAPVDRSARVLRRELPSPMFAFGRRHPTSQSSLKA